MAKIKSSVSEEVISKAIGAGGKFIVTELTADGPKPVYDAMGALLTFRSGDLAGRRAAQLSADQGKKFQPRPINDDGWRDREKARSSTKEYLALPWEKERWWVDLKDIWGDHYPHVAIKDGAFVAFTESAEKGAADIQTRIKPGKYLERYFAEVLNQYVIRDLCAAFAEKYEDNMLQWATTREEIKEVYLTGPSSCMSKGMGSYKSGDIHPCEVYAAGDLQVVYLKKSGKVSARAVCWPDKKTYTTIYGDKGRLEPLLKKLGYSFEPPYGAKLLKVKVPVGKQYSYLTPHLDGVGWVWNDGDTLRVGTKMVDDAKSIAAGGAAGVTEVLGFGCSHCGQDHFTQKNIASVFYNDSKAQNWCMVCAKKDALQCSVSGYWVKRDQFIDTTSGKPMWARLQKTHGFICEGSGKLAWQSDRVPMKDGSNWSRQHFKEHGYACKCGDMLKSKDECNGRCKMETVLKAKAKAEENRYYVRTNPAPWILT